MGVILNQNSVLAEPTRPHRLWRSSLRPPDIDKLEHTAKTKQSASWRLRRANDGDVKPEMRHSSAIDLDDHDSMAAIRAR